MFREVEKVATSSGLHFVNRGDEWTPDSDCHIAAYEYALSARNGNGDDLDVVGRVDGYRISQDWTVESDLQLWEEADALDGDIVRYVEALIRELRACEKVWGLAPDLAHAQRITMVRHVEPTRGVDSVELTRGAVASIAMMDAPVLMLVDPWPMAKERALAKGKLKGRSHIPALLNMGFVRMIGSRFLWAWNYELSEGLMANYSYESLRSAEQSGGLADILATPLADSVYGKLPRHLAEIIDVPDPDDLETE